MAANAAVVFGGHCLRARDGEFRAPARVPFFFCKKKGTKENHLDVRSKDPWRGAGKCKFGGADLAELARRGTLSVQGTACTSCAAAADNSEGRGWCAGRVAIIKSRLWRLAAAKVGVPVGHGYIYFLACDTAERIIFAVVAGSGSGKLCWHSRGNDNDQENAGYVRENGQRRTGVAPVGAGWGVSCPGTSNFLFL